MAGVHNNGQLPGWIMTLVYIVLLQDFAWLKRVCVQQVSVARSKEAKGLCPLVMRCSHLSLTQRDPPIHTSSKVWDRVTVDESVFACVFMCSDFTRVCVCVHV